MTVEEQMIIQGELAARLDKQLAAFLQRTDEWINTAETRMAKAEVQQQVYAERFNAFIQRFEKFLSGPGGNEPGGNDR